MTQIRCIDGQSPTNIQPAVVTNIGASTTAFDAR